MFHSQVKFSHSIACTHPRLTFCITNMLAPLLSYTFKDITTYAHSERELKFFPRLKILG